MCEGVVGFRIEEKKNRGSVYSLIFCFGGDKIKVWHESMCQTFIFLLDMRVIYFS